jgi:hypothetical protein
MKIKIELLAGTSSGSLVINGERKMCPFSETDLKHPHCGTWCALFGEPDADNISDKTLITISLCHAFLACSPEDFTDERPIKKEVEG